ncbi:hypothetical protein M407DRAFT_247251 [Tulasnella calospora MUT 4182]|uniref:Uncharacterized protein n=1 Tax=Tulasnella calospora MUT 4182 TaxID=1051891 RepID=A0A0C3L0M1_9AGAM|nr:hypothetical protein M407DRAFT_247251 [Tulasnella calospora MUT 4182]
MTFIRSAYTTELSFTLFSFFFSFPPVYTLLDLSASPPDLISLDGTVSSPHTPYYQRL